jgi:asparagine N-glycosylation enzyme membrane subunit Stt3
MNFAGENWSQWLAFVLAAFAAFWVIRGALAGSLAHRIPRMTLGVVVLFISVFYALAATDAIGDATSAALIRGGSFILWPTIAWTSITGMRYAAKMRHLASVLEGTETDEGAWKQHG